MSASTLHSTLPSESRGELAASWPVQGRPRGHRCRRTESVRTLPKSTRLSGAPLWAALKATGVLKGACSEARREVCHDSDCSVSAHLDVPAYTNTFPHSRRLEQMKTDPSNRVQIPSREHVNVEVQYNLRYNFFSMGQMVKLEVTQLTWWLLIYIPCNVLISSLKVQKQYTVLLEQDIFQVVMIQVNQVSWHENTSGDTYIFI